MHSFRFFSTRRPLGFASSTINFLEQASAASRRIDTPQGTIAAPTANLCFGCAPWKGGAFQWMQVVRILDRIVHNAHRLELDGPSMRKLRAGEQAEPEAQPAKQAARSASSQTKPAKGDQK
jgi:hypothetical protein